MLFVSDLERGGAPLAAPLISPSGSCEVGVQQESSGCMVPRDSMRTIELCQGRIGSEGLRTG